LSRSAFGYSAGLLLWTRIAAYVPEDGGPAGFYARLGFVVTGQLDMNGEVIVRLVLP
jgi:hypothetical protein